MPRAESPVSRVAHPVARVLVGLVLTPAPRPHLAGRTRTDLSLPRASRTPSRLGQSALFVQQADGTPIATPHRKVLRGNLLVSLWGGLPFSASCRARTILLRSALRSHAVRKGRPLRAGQGVPAWDQQRCSGPPNIRCQRIRSGVRRPEHRSAGECLWRSIMLPNVCVGLDRYNEGILMCCAALPPFFAV